MLKSKNPYYKALLIFNLVLLIPCAVINILCIVKDGALYRMDSIFAIIALIVAFYYVLKGYTKNQAWAYTCFAFCFIVVNIVDIAVIASGEPEALSVMLYSASIALITAAAFVNDLGKTKSAVICGMMAVLYIVALVQALTATPTATADLIRAVSNLLLSAVLGLITTGKYIDKDRRGTK